jgi:hypothetical protein
MAELNNKAMASCPECKEETPVNSDYAVSIREFGECVDCKIAHGDFYEDDLIWIKFIQDK